MPHLTWDPTYCTLVMVVPYLTGLLTGIKWGCEGQRYSIFNWLYCCLATCQLFGWRNTLQLFWPSYYACHCKYCKSMTHSLILIHVKFNVLSTLSKFYMMEQLTWGGSGRGGSWGACAVFRVSSRCSFSLWHWRAALGCCASLRRLTETIRHQNS